MRREEHQLGCGDWERSFIGDLHPSAISFPFISAFLLCSSRVPSIIPAKAGIHHPSTKIKPQVPCPDHCPSLCDVRSQSFDVQRERSWLLPS